MPARRGAEPEVLARYQQRWHYLHVDEFQDCNLLQYRLVRLLAWGTQARHEGRGHLCAVGDDDQMIYTWRGASAHNVLHFERDFPAVQVILLEQNYRSTQTILDAALGVVRRNRLRDTPHWAILVAAAVPIVIVVATRGSTTILGDLYAFGLLGAFSVTCVSLDIVRGRHESVGPDQPPQIRAIDAGAPRRFREVAAGLVQQFG